MRVLASALNGRKVGNAIAMAVLDLDATNGNIVVGNNLDVRAHANELGNGLASASANALLDPAGGSAHSINIGGSVSVVADAFNLGMHGNAIARADANFQASNAVNINNALVVDAFAFDSYGATASAKAVLTISGKTVSIGHGLESFTTITANGDRGNTRHFGHRNFRRRLRHRSRSGRQCGGRRLGQHPGQLRERCHRYGNVTVGGAAIFSAVASDTGGHSANAQANVHVNGANVTFNGGTVDINGPNSDFIGIFERAIANAGNDGTAIANAIGSVYANNALLINGEVVDVAFALNPGGGGNALADANLSLTANGGNATINGSLLVVAACQRRGRGFGGRQCVRGHHGRRRQQDNQHRKRRLVFANAHNGGGVSGQVAASANAHLNFAGATSVNVGNYVNVAAFADNFGSGGVQAHGILDFHGASKLTLGNVLIDVEALNKNSQGTGGADARANFTVGAGVTIQKLSGLNIEAVASSAGGDGASARAIANITQLDSLTIAGDVTVNAMAVNADGTGKALALADLSLNAQSGGITVSGSVDVEAHATESAQGPAKANAVADFATTDGFGVDITGAVTVLANAYNGSGAGGPGKVAASANAQLEFFESGIGAKDVTVGSAMSIVAHATNEGSGHVKADGAVVFDPVALINLGPVTIDVEALNEGDGKGGANANANFTVGAGVTIQQLSGLNIEAVASSAGGHGASANAIVNITQLDSLTIVATSP